MIRKDLTGKKIGRLTVLKLSDSYKKNKKVKWMCQCECGNIVEVFSSNLIREHTKSCGCLAHEEKSKRMKENNSKYKHGKNNTRIYNIYQSMKKRCYLKTHIHYSNYGGRGIKVCDKWKNDFMSFYNWAMENGYRDDLTIDRIDVNGNYEPNNCRWATTKQQAYNKRNNKIVFYKNKKYIATQLAREYNVNPDRFLERIRNGWDIEKALLTPVRKRGDNICI